jgi:mRNA interferase MazF
MMMSNPKQGDVWYADYDGIKKRPVVIVANELAVDIDYTIAKVTTHSPRSQFDISLDYWEEAGLKRPSIVRANKLFTINYHELLYKIGELHEDDLIRVIDACKRIF